MTMPPIKSVTSLEKLCTDTIGDHFFTTFSSWYRDTEPTTIVSQEAEHKFNKETWDSNCEIQIDSSDCFSDGGKNNTDKNIENEFDYSDCYHVEGKNKEFKDGDYDEVEGKKNADRNKWFVKLLTEGTMHSEEEDGEANDLMDCEFEDTMCEDKDSMTSKDNHGGTNCESDDRRDTRALSPVPHQHQVGSVMSSHLSNQVKDFVSFHMPPKFHDNLLATLLSLTASRVEIPRPKQKTRSYVEDLHFINYLGFLLRVIVSSLLTSGVASLDFSSVSHLMKRWKLLCWGGETIDHKGVSINSPYFDIFSYALSVTLRGLRTLRQLKLPHFVHDSFVRKVGFLCPSLEVLMLRCSSDCNNPKHVTPVVTSLEVLYGNTYECPDSETLVLPGCKHLVSLALPEGVEHLDVSNEVVEMLSYMPHLERLVGAPMLYVCEEITLMHDDDDTDPFTLNSLKLTNFHHGAYGKSDWPAFVYDETLQDGTFAHLSKLPELFPNVKEVAIYAPDEATEKVLLNFSKADEITLFTDDFDIHGKHLKNLTCLDINIGYQVEWSILLSLSQTCPNLEQLTLRSFSLLFVDSDDTQVKFPSLQSLRFYGQNVVGRNAFLAVIHGCPILTTLIMSTVTDDENQDTHIDDATLCQALPYIPHVEKFAYKVQSALRSAGDFTASLTLDSCWALINACPHLAYIGQLDTWNVTRAEIEVLLEEVRRRNWDIEIVG